MIWWFYSDLKAYCRDPTAEPKAALRARFDRIFKRRTGFATLDRATPRSALACGRHGADRPFSARQGVAPCKLYQPG
jgi:hypothetical protein